MDEGTRSATGVGSGLAGFYGKFRLRLDAKGRLTLPSIYRRALGVSPEDDCHVVLRKGPEGFVQVIPLETWDGIVRNQSSTSATASGRERQWQRRLQNSDVDIAPLDPKGRLTVPQELVEHAGCERDVIVVGTGRLMEIWDPKTFFETAEQMSVDGAAIDDELYA